MSLGSAGTPGPEPRAPAPIPADVGVVAALSIEVGYLIDRLERVRRYAGPRRTIIEGECAGKVVALLVGGPGAEAARRATRTLIDGHRPAWMLSVGFGGALDPALRRNDVVFADEVVAESGGRWAIDVGMPPDAEGRRFRAGRLLTVDRIIRTAAEKARLHREFEADVVDMETAAVASECAERGVRLLAIRVVSDEADVDLPPEILSMIGPTGVFRLGAALGALWRRPSSVKRLWTLREHAIEAADRLAEVVEGSLGRLP